MTNSSEILVTLDSGAVLPLSLALEVDGREAPPEPGPFEDAPNGRTMLRLQREAEFRARVQRTLQVCEPPARPAPRWSVAR